MRGAFPPRPNTPVGAIRVVLSLPVRGPDGPCFRPDLIREIAREGIAYQDKSPYLYRKMLWSIYNQDTR